MVVVKLILYAPQGLVAVEVPPNLVVLVVHPNLPERVHSSARHNH